MKGGRKQGGFHPAGDIRDAKRILVAEGVATLAAARKGVALPGIAAMDLGNLENAARSVRSINPNVELVFLADNDIRSDGGNPGLEAANAAARALGGLVAVPEMDSRACDFWDVWSERGPEGVRVCYEGARAPEGGPGAESSVIVVRGDELKVEPIRWQWDGYLARGKLHVLAGAPGAGKSTIAIGLAATVTVGGQWPDGTKCDPADALVWSDEDAVKDTLLPRFLAAGGDPKRLHIVAGMRESDGPRDFDPATDIPALRERARQIPQVGLTLIDPVVAAVLADSHKNTEVRRALRPLVSFAAELDAAVLGISHFTKGTAGRDPVERVTGSVAFGALPRVVMAAAKACDNGDAERRIFCRAKSNIGPDYGGWVYRLVLTEVPGAPGITVMRAKWGEALEGTARELLAETEVVETQDERSERSRDSTRLEVAKGWLRDLLTERREMMVTDIEAEAKSAGFAWRLIRDAKDDLGIRPKQAGFHAGWKWSLPPATAHTDDAHTLNTDDATSPVAKTAPDKDSSTDDVTASVRRESASPIETATCPRCAGEGCKWCGGMGRLVDDQPEGKR
jgi:putative DNA primase/helicase